MGNVADALEARATEPEFLQAVIDLVQGGYRLLHAAAPEVKLERTCLLPYGSKGEDCGLHEHEAPTIVLRETTCPWTWRFWPEPEHSCWLAEFASDYDSPDQWTPVFKEAEYGEAPRLSSDADFLAMWIVALTGPDV